MECLYYIVRKEDNYRVSVTAEEDNKAPFRSAQTRGLVPATGPLKSLHEGTGRRDLSHEQFTRSVLRHKSSKSQGLVPKIQTGLNSWD